MSTTAAPARKKTPEENGAHPAWKPGECPNPAGRPKGSRNKLGEAFIEALHADFREHGPDVIVKVREDKPDQYLKVVASLLPRQLEIKEGAFDGIDEEQIAALVVAARSALGIAQGGREGAGDQARPQSLN